MPLIIDPSPRCAGTFVNDVFGPDRPSAAKAPLRSEQNVKFRALVDGAGFPHAFWQVRARGFDLVCAMPHRTHHPLSIQPQGVTERPATQPPPRLLLEQVIKPTPPGAPLLGDYGDAFWAAGPPAAPSEGEGEWRQMREALALSAMMRRLMNALRGRTAAYPINCDCDDAATTGGA